MTLLLEGNLTEEALQNLEEEVKSLHFHGAVLRLHAFTSIPQDYCGDWAKEIARLNPNSLLALSIRSRSRLI